ncbi:LeoA/HP0731 family dynamin-like GTPase [Comamonas sp. E6]|uniref:LeoA/HP0731 family dynamin-like GTPase n=1 Tax=Comamonas sp. E6 TaxID=364029 RepID=UPI0006300310|nr:LeoA/HP0731 family dynamin-like GTPase [Comamonas sp. E6]GAO72929.1 dynamin family protein [Comamonas sp. E6]
MNNTLNQFKNQQAQMLNLLNELKEVVQQGEQAGMPHDPKLDDKIQTALRSVSGDKLKVALVGGFSEGKTSIAAAWMERLDKSSMNISHQESSNEVKVYEVDGDFVLIDTPGLFGFKEQMNAETHAVEKYKDITKKYVSEAHLVLYVMNSTNPIKESHKEDLQWLFRTLNLLPRTVFVLSRFDEIADVEDEADYDYNFSIKRKNVHERLSGALHLTSEEQENLSIVAVAANPFDQGVEYWLQNLEEFKALSHIHTLQKATSDKIKQRGYGVLVQEMQASVINDILGNQLPQALDNHQQISEQVDKLSRMSTDLAGKLNRTSRDIEDARISLRDFATQYFSDLIIQARGCSMETFAEFYEREIGAEGVNVATRLQKEFSQRTQSINFEMQKMQVNFDSEVNHFNVTLKSLGKQGVNHVLKGNMINNSTVLAARDGVVSVAKTVGLDIGKYLKFKPWGAVNFAKGANGMLSVLGIALEAWDTWEKWKREDEFKKAIKKMVEDFEKQRQDFIDLVNLDSFCDDFFPQYTELNQKIKELKLSLNESLNRQLRFERWAESAKAMEVKFRMLN